MKRLCLAAFVSACLFCALTVPQAGLCAGSSLSIKITNNSPLALHFRFVDKDGYWRPGQAMNPGDILNAKHDKFCRLTNPSGQAEVMFMVGSPRQGMFFSYGFKATYTSGGRPSISYRTQIAPRPPHVLKVSVSNDGVGPDGGKVSVTFE